jgi:ornithine decarboxylase
MSFGNTVKRASDIAFAHAAGITLFAADAEEELEKIAEHAPGAQVYIRLIVEASGADWPLTRKFGTSRDKVLTLMGLARDLGLAPVGLSFHVGSQTRDPAMWETRSTRSPRSGTRRARRASRSTFSTSVAGSRPSTATTSRTRRSMPPPSWTGSTPVSPACRASWRSLGRGLVAEAGMIAAEVLLVSRKSDDDLCRWVYLDIGKFSGSPRRWTRRSATSS